MALIDAIPGLRQARTTREAIRRIRELPVEKRIQKELLANFFQARPGAGINLRRARELLDLGVDLAEVRRILRREGRFEAFNQLLDRFNNRRLLG